MLIPNADKAVVDIRKLRNYCLDTNHDDGKHKARLFSSILGMTADDAEALRQILLEIVRIEQGRLGRQDRFGQRYVLDFEINGRIEVQSFGAVGLLSMVRKFRD